jgi:hypothetical protein
VLLFRFGQVEITLPQLQKALAAVFVVSLLRQGCALISLKSEPFDGHGGTSELRQVHRSIIYTALQ